MTKTPIQTINRKHPECLECRFRRVKKLKCSGHAPGETKCSIFKKAKIKKTPEPYFRGITQPFQLVLAIDPGPIYSGFAVLSDTFEIIHTGKWTNDQLLQSIRRGLLPGDAIIQEMLIPYGRSGKSVCDTLVWLGIFEEAWQSKNISEPKPFKALRITTRSYFIPSKKNLPKFKETNPLFPDTADAQIRYMLIKRWKETFQADLKDHPKLSNDAWQALALAVYFMDKVNEYKANTIAYEAKPLQLVGLLK